MNKTISGQYAFRTDVGKVRMTNEDRVGAYTNLNGDHLLLVCDGMGGTKKGGYASTIAIKVISEAFMNHTKHFLNRFFASQWLAKTIRKANTEIFNTARDNQTEYKGMGTTCTAVLIINNYIVVGQVGDSRCYMMDKEDFKQITQDQSYVGYLFRTGQISEEEMKTHPKRNVLTNALGIYPSTSADVRTFVLNDKTLLLCSDGLYNNVNTPSMEAVMRSNDLLSNKLEELIAIANANGGSDNIGVVLWEAIK